MTNKAHSLRLAGSAIAAALALASTPSFAQDAAAPFQPAPDPAPAPVLVVPDIPEPAAPEPTLVLPSEVPDATPVPDATVEIPVPQPSPSATAVRTRTTTTAAERAVAGPAPRAAASQAAPAEPVAAPLPAAVTEPVAAEPVAPVAAEQPASRPATTDTGMLALILGGLAFIALAIWGFVAIGRRKPVRRYVAESPATKRAPVAPKPAFVHGPVVAPPALPLGASFAPRPAPVNGALPHAGASVALPARVPETFAERDALMKRMVEAKPDRANPFTDRGARTKRARLILASLGRDFGDAEPWIDLSQYPHNWPELARKRSAAA